MLGIHGIGRDKADYYLSDLALELPVAGPGRWAGSAAEGLGLAGTVRADQFTQRAGRPPAAVRGAARFGTGVRGGVRPHVQRAEVGQRAVRAGRCRRRAAPSWRRTADAVAGSLSYLEQHGITAARRSGPDRVVLPTSGAVAAVFTHGVSRNGDPHLHSHVVVANLVHGADGRWSACDRRGMDAHRRAASAVYEAHLRAGLTAAFGVRWTASARAFGRSGGYRARAAGRVLEPGRGHPPPHARTRCALARGRTRRLGGDASRQGAERAVCRSARRTGDSGPRRSAATSSWSRAVSRGDPPCSTSTATQG